MKKITSVLFASAITTLASIGTAEALPAGWACVGNCGTLGADGVVTASPFSSDYEWISTDGGIGGIGQIGGAGGTNGSTLTTNLFAANAGDTLSFFFNYITADGAGFADHAWATLYDSTFSSETVLFTARTTPSGNTVPGFGLPGLAPGVTLAPASTAIIGGGPTWSPLGSDSGFCFDAGCGYTDWILMNYIVPTAGNY